MTGTCYILSPFLNQFWIATRLVCSFCEAMVGSLPVASTAVSLAKVSMVDSDGVGGSAVHSRYNNGSRTLFWDISAFNLENSTTVKDENHHYSSQYSACLVVKLMVQPNNNKQLQRHMPNNLPVRLLVCRICSFSF
jgi:hypothetical protein